MKIKFVEEEVKRKFFVWMYLTNIYDYIDCVFVLTHITTYFDIKYMVGCNIKSNSPKKAWRLKDASYG